MYYVKMLNEIISIALHEIDQEYQLLIINIDGLYDQQTANEYFRA